MSGEPLLVLDGLEKAYGALKVTSGVTLQVAPGEAVGILGPNGAGKTTLFGLIAGSVRADGGSVRFAGRDITRLAPHARCRLGIARSHQIPAPFAAMTVFENLLVGAAFGANPTAEAGDRCADVLTRTGLMAKADRRAGELTLLERKRLELARALAAGPTLLLLDEIAGGLTEGECQQLVEVIGAVRATGVTLIWVEHVLHALMGVAERLIVLNFGRVIADGPATQIMGRADVREIYLGTQSP